MFKYILIELNKCLKCYYITNKLLLLILGFSSFIPFKMLF